ncbi:16S rRNA (guanine(527)-N(7))-methyltransferase RsmG [Vibrio sp. SS-MA-C1-2]|uniref:16S rRNA (guanine(527)-N(7))-methyltransferase RsmG n=1 Tax=Vibrio sp. SS-MA-C1-2 TaxID=2908646 RepID=UPI001F1DE6AD|nr:16S rRNA (guanine(527)-N(7))-methyltransferase RsmG [Vibrio sp. SS-MA-C1-2]UJF19332.1 16S rRNA (guanine(527)-N(7))-methyltransferase RsmG [Vibrio sp. SS-MA-C1-2]
MKQKLKALIEQTEVTVTEEQLDKLVALVEMLHKWNKAYNLTSVRDPNEMLTKHIVDSIVVSPYLNGNTFIDVGTGPGLPGLPLAIINPDKQFTLLDSLGKRIRFIRQVVHELGLKNVTPVQSRVEEFESEEGFDLVLSRAFASMSDMVGWCRHLPTKEHGRFLALKGVYPQQEIDELPTWCKVEKIDHLQVPQLDGERHLVLIKAS